VVAVTKDDQRQCNIDVVVITDGAVSTVDFQHVLTCKLISIECGGSLPALAPAATSPQCEPQPVQEASFYVSDYYAINVVDRAGQWEEGSLVMGRNNRTACDQFRQYLQYSADVGAGGTVEGLDVSDIASKHVSWRKFLPKMDTFTLDGAPSGQICGLQTSFHFVNIGNNQFSKNPHLSTPSERTS
jgi:hypothetical protein